MQDIDFGKAYRRRPAQQADRNQSKPAGSKLHGLMGRLTFGVSIFVVAFTIGLVAGMHFQKQRISAQLDADIAEQEVNKTSNVAAAGIDKKECEPPHSWDAELNRCIRKKEKPAETKILQPGKKNSYIILGKIYPDKKKAYKAGLTLMKQGIKVFLAESGNRMKLYVGPVEGKKEAYNMLARIKKHTEFRGAILYKK